MNLLQRLYSKDSKVGMEEKRVRILSLMSALSQRQCFQLFPGDYLSKPQKWSAQKTPLWFSPSQAIWGLVSESLLQASPPSTRGKALRVLAPFLIIQFASIDHIITQSLPWPLNSPLKQALRIMSSMRPEVLDPRWATPVGLVPFRLQVSPGTTAHAPSAQCSSLQCPGHEGGCPRQAGASSPFSIRTQGWVYPQLHPVFPTTTILHGNSRKETGICIKASIFLYWPQDFTQVICLFSASVSHL